jgi:UDP-glucose 4-epimerase
MTNILVVGGAGYVGSHCCLDLHMKGFTPIVFDNLSNGHAEFVRWGPLEQGDINDRARLDEVFSKHKPIAIIHLAGLIEVGESTKNPLLFFQNNVSGTIALLSAALDAGVDKLVFSSTCATYGLPLQNPIEENHPQSPINPYGRSKLVVEQILQDLSMYQNFSSVVLRYFNAAGADPEGRIGERHFPETHVLPLAIDVAVGTREVFKIFGSDYATRDGTCIRDFVHVMDLADAHTRSVNYLLAGGSSTSLNLGSGTGTTVRELVKMVEAMSGHIVPIERAPRRVGDAPVLVASSQKAAAVLHWKPTQDLESIISTAWNWHRHGNASKRTNAELP